MNLINFGKDLKKDLAMTFLTQLAVLFAAALVYKFAAIFFGKEGFAEYALSRRTIAFIQPLILLGLGVAMPRYIAYDHDDMKPGKTDSYFISGTVILIIVVLVFMAVFNTWKNTFAFLLFGSSAYYYLIHPVSLIILGVVLHSVCYNYFRGNIHMGRANTIQVINLCFVPMLAFVLHGSPQQVLTLTGLGCTVVSLIYIAAISTHIKISRLDLVPSAKKLLIYGLQRVPGDIGAAALFSLPAIFTAHVSGIKEAGYVAFGISFLNMIGGFFFPIGLVFLPKASRIVADKDFDKLKYYVDRIFKTTFFITVSGVIVFEMFAEQILRPYLGKNFSDIVSCVRIVAVGGVFYSTYVVMKCVIDACYVIALNARNILFSLAVFLLLSWIGTAQIKGYLPILFSFIVSLFILGSLTLFEVRKIIKRRCFEKSS